jgi:hypothetical protein
MSSLIIPFPTELRPPLPTIVGNVDYLTLRRRLEQIESLLQASGLEADFVEKALQGWLAARLRSSHRPAATEVSTAQPAGAALHDPAHAACKRIIGALAAPWRAVPCISGFVWWTRWTRCACPPRASCNVSPTGWMAGADAPSDRAVFCWRGWIQPERWI